VEDVREEFSCRSKGKWSLEVANELAIEILGASVDLILRAALEVFRQIDVSCRGVGETHHDLDDCVTR
jgi:hypothetical protein